MTEPREPAPDAAEWDTEWDTEWELEDEDETPRVSSLDGPPRATGASRWPPRGGLMGRWRWGLRLGALAAAVALLGALASGLTPLLAPLLPQPLAHAAQSDIISLDLAPGLSDCATTGYWSPDSQHIAVLRSPTACGMTTREPDVFVYDASSGAETTAYHITASALAALARAGAGGWTIAYDQIAWAPNQRTLAVLFHAESPIAAAPHDKSRSGVALIALDRPTVSAVTITLASAPSTMDALPPPGQVVGTMWDTGQGGARTLTIPVAQAYDWLPDDSLVATEPYPGSGAVGAPSLSWRPFSVWRTGALSVANTAQCQRRSGVRPTTPPAPFALLTLSVATWSLDSRYLLAFQTRARMDAPSIPLDASAAVCLTSAEVSALPVAPIHDWATRDALGQFGARDAERMTLLWSPDAKRLTVISSGSTIPATAVTIYDTTTGLALTRITAGGSQIPGAQGSDAEAIISGAAWSPNGRRLLVAITGLRFNIRVYGGDTLG